MSAQKERLGDGDAQTDEHTERQVHARRQGRRTAPPSARLRVGRRWPRRNRFGQGHGLWRRLALTDARARARPQARRETWRRLLAHTPAPAVAKAPLFIFLCRIAMEEVSLDDKLKLASTYLVNSPPGEFIDVFNGWAKGGAAVRFDWRSRADALVESARARGSRPFSTRCPRPDQQRRGAADGCCWRIPRV